MSVPKCLSFQDLEGLTEVFGGMSAGMSGPKLPLWAEFTFLRTESAAICDLRFGALRPTHLALWKLLMRSGGNSEVSKRGWRQSGVGARRSCPCQRFRPLFCELFPTPRLGEVGINFFCVWGPVSGQPPPAQPLFQTSEKWGRAKFTLSRQIAVMVSEHGQVCCCFWGMLFCGSAFKNAPGKGL